MVCLTRSSEICQSINNAVHYLCQLCSSFPFYYIVCLLNAFDIFYFNQVAFKMYDLDGDNMISRDELLNVLHMMVGANISDEQVSQSWYVLTYVTNNYEYEQCTLFFLCLSSVPMN